MWGALAKSAANKMIQQRIMSMMPGQGDPAAMGRVIGQSQQMFQEAEAGTAGENIISSQGMVSSQAPLLGSFLKGLMQEKVASMFEEPSMGEKAEAFGAEGSVGGAGGAQRMLGSVQESFDVQDTLAKGGWDINKVRDFFKAQVTGQGAQWFGDWLRRALNGQSFK